MEEILFFVAGIMAIAFSLAVIISKDIVHSAVSLAGVFIAIAILYITLNAFFLSAVQILVYVGGVIVLLLFAIMLIKSEKKENEKKNINIILFLGVLFGILMLAIITNALLNADVYKDSKISEISANNIASNLFGNFLLPFEALAILLTAGVVGAIIIAFKEHSKKEAKW